MWAQFEAVTSSGGHFLGAACADGGAPGSAVLGRGGVTGPGPRAGMPVRAWAPMRCGLRPWTLGAPPWGRGRSIE